MKLGLVHNPIFLRHAIDEGHPECPERFRYFPTSWQRAGNELTTIEPRSALERDLLLVHSQELLRSLGANRGKQGWLDPDTYFGSESVDVALLAAGATMDLARSIWRGNLDRGFSLVRPPGHHAVAGRSQGFCLLNNVALAVQAILNEATDARIAIVDFDLHHGNGTQEIFYWDKRVLFISSHRFPYYPGTGDIDEVGEGAAKGNVFNFPVGLPHGDDFFVTLYREFVGPILRQFRPQMILVSAGFDGHIQDPMQGFRMTTATYRKLASILIAEAERSAGGKILFCLEGGYDPRAVGEAVATVWDEINSISRSEVLAHGDFAELTRYRESFRSMVPSL